MTEFEQINPGVWKPTVPNDTIEGVLIDVQKSSKFDSNIYHLETEDGKQIAIFETTVLSDKMAYVKPGDLIKIVYTGVQNNSKGQPTKLFTVFKAKKTV